MDTVIESNTRVVNDSLLLQKVLTPYFAHTKYLKAADMQVFGDPNDSGIVSGRGQFAIPKSCYINDTGHLNAVEFNICYNQIMYYIIALAVKHKKLQALHNWTLDTFFQKQLPDILIVGLNSKYRKPLNPKNFFGQIDFLKTTFNRSKSTLFINTICSFSETENGEMHCSGEVDLAIVKADQV